MTKYAVAYVDLVNGELRPFGGPFNFSELYDTFDEALAAIRDDAEDCKDGDMAVFDEKTLTLTYANPSPATHSVWKIQSIEVN